MQEFIDNYKKELLLDEFNKLIDKWDFEKLSCQHNLPFHIIQAHLDKPWDWYHMSIRSIPWQFIRDHSNYNWN